MRAISPAISTIFLIGVAVVGAIAAGNAMFMQNEISQKTARLDLVDVSLVRISEDMAYFAASIKNSGTVTFATAEVGFADDSGIFHTITVPTPLNPGEQFGSYIIENVGITTDKKYLINMNGTTTTGATFHFADTVVAKG